LRERLAKGLKLKASGIDGGSLRHQKKMSLGQSFYKNGDLSLLGMMNKSRSRFKPQKNSNSFLNKENKKKFLKKKKFKSNAKEIPKSLNSQSLNLSSLKLQNKMERVRTGNSKDRGDNIKNLNFRQKRLLKYLRNVSNGRKNNAKKQHKKAKKLAEILNRENSKFKLNRTAGSNISFDTNGPRKSPTNSKVELSKSRKNLLKTRKIHNSNKSLELNFKRLAKGNSAIKSKKKFECQNKHCREVLSKHKQLKSENEFLKKTLQKAISIISSSNMSKKVSG
jgi:hypothetical protein